MRKGMNVVELHIDRQRAMDLAREMGITISFNNPQPGVITNTPQGKAWYSFLDLFPEIYSNFVMVEECILTTLKFTPDNGLAKTGNLV
jgi:hypothetical protein